MENYFPKCYFAFKPMVVWTLLCGNIERLVTNLFTIDGLYNTNLNILIFRLFKGKPQNSQVVVPELKNFARTAYYNMLL